MYKTINYENINSIKNFIVIDVRTPKEYEEDHIINSINIPIFSDEERIEVGTIYKKSKDEAKLKGINFISKKLNIIAKQIFELDHNYKNFIFYCARGGIRSGTITALFSELGLSCYKLEGGYKSYRNFILDNIEDVVSKLDFIVLQGKTGVGKTLILDKLKKENYPVLDLEDLANHRGSIFGNIGLNEQPSQKNFDTLLYNELHKHLDKKYIILESESKRIGKITLPESIYKKIISSKKIYIETNIDFRVDLLKQIYLDSNEENNEIFDLISKLEKYMAKEKIDTLTSLIKNNKIDDAVKLMLENHYDPLYKRNHSKENIIKTINLESIDESIKDIKFLLNEITNK